MISLAKQWISGVVAMAVYGVFLVFMPPLYRSVWRPLLGEVTPENIASIPFVPVFLANATGHVMMALLGSVGIVWLSRLGTRLPRQMARKDALYLAFLGAMAAIALGTVTVLPATLWFQFTQGQLPTWPNVPGYLPYSATLLLVTAPIGEELLYRRYMFPSLTYSFGRPVAHMVTVLAFWLPHGLENWMPLGAGIALALLWELTGRLEAVVLAHSLVNLASVRFSLEFRLIALGVVGLVAVYAWQRWDARGRSWRQSLLNAYLPNELTPNNVNRLDGSV